MIMCFVLLLNLFMNFFLKTYYLQDYLYNRYTHSITLTIQAIVCCIIILDMFSNVLVHDIVNSMSFDEFQNYILTASYYYDMFLIVSSIITIALLIITHAYSTTISMVLILFIIYLKQTWLRIELSLQSLKYIIPSIKMILQNQHDVNTMISIYRIEEDTNHSRTTITF